MALADRRPLDLPVHSAQGSPTFNPKTLDDGRKLSHSSRTDHELAEDDNEDIEMMDEGDEEEMEDDSDNEEDKSMEQEKSLSPSDLSPTSRSISPDSLMNSEMSFKRIGGSNVPTAISNVVPSSTSSSSRGSTPPMQQVKKPKNTSRVPIATGISTTIPVTGEKPKPDQTDDPSLEDDVLYAIFLILYEKDPEGKGMTVKQICDILVERHPEMANLSSKTSNLVSAKLNAYVKRVEKGDSSLKYALSRDWADASPKRMVYVYRGLLTKDFHVHVKSMMETQKQFDSKNQTSHSQSQSSFDDQSIEGHDEISSLEAGKQASLSKPRRQTMFDLGISKNSFLNSPMDRSNLFVPYSSAPVTASLKDKTDSNSSSNQQTETNPSKPVAVKKFNNESDLDLEDIEVFNENGNDQDFMETVRKNGKRSKSMSYLSNKKHKILTAAAAAPRAPRTPCSHSPNAAAAAAALHAAAIKAISASSSSSSSSMSVSGGFKSERSLSSDSADVSLKSAADCCNKKWVNVIRSGFLSQDIGTPEDISLSDLDKFFN